MVGRKKLEWIQVAARHLFVQDIRKLFEFGRIAMVLFDVLGFLRETGEVFLACLEFSNIGTGLVIVNNRGTNVTGDEFKDGCNLFNSILVFDDECATFLTVGQL